MTTPSSYRTIDQPVHTELVEKKSRFLCSLYPCPSEAEAATWLDRTRKAHPDASHHCSALRLTDGCERSHDDGEPSGTAGRPMLHVLQRHELTDVLAIVTRYFGGTLLGAGGLTRAYTQVVVDATTAASVIAWLPHAQYAFTLAYGEYDRALHLCSQEGWDVSAQFAETVEMQVSVPESDQANASRIIAALTRDNDAATPRKIVLQPVRQPS